jgi:ADP-heptose:LPS heptosyltransferase
LIGIQVLSNSPARTPSVDYWSFVINYLAKNIPNSLFFIIIEKKHEATYHELTKRLGNQVELNRIINTTNYFNSLSGLFEFIPLLNIVITPDSSVIHIAEGFGIPGVGLYGPYPSSLRTSSYKNCISIDTELNCAPCFILGHSPCTEALKLNKINSPCMESFSPEKILQAVNELLDKK